MEIEQAARQCAKLRMAIMGPSGSGKTFSALLLSKGLVDGNKADKFEKVCLIDTESGSGHLYADLGPYRVLSLAAPFSPERFIEAIRTAEKAGFEVIIIDSLSAEWSGDGGILDLQGKLADTKYRGNSWSAWREVTPRHNALIEAILNSPAHIVATMRSKTEYLQIEENGKRQIKKVGMAPIQRESIDFEFTLVFDLNAEHLAYATKDRTGLFDGQSLRISEETGSVLKQWLNPAHPARPDEAKRMQGAKSPTKSTARGSAGAASPPVQVVSPEPAEEEYVLLANDKVRAAGGQEYVKLVLSLEGKHHTVWSRDLNLANLEVGSIIKTVIKQNKGAFYVDSYEVVEEAVA